jgi:hypothetical protein
LLLTENYLRIPYILDVADTDVSMIPQFRFFCLIPFIINAWLSSKRIADANLSLAYLNGISYVLDTRPRGWNVEKKIVSTLKTFAYLYMIDIFSESSCFLPEQQEYVHALSRISILLSFGFVLVNKQIVENITLFAYTYFTLYLLLTSPCEFYYASLGGFAIVITSILYLFKSPSQHIGFAAYLYCVSKSLTL